MSLMNSLGGRRVIYAWDGIQVTGIACEATTRKGEPCQRNAEYRQVQTGRLVCHTHRFAKLP